MRPVDGSPSSGTPLTSPKRLKKLLEDNCYLHSDSMNEFNDISSSQIKSTLLSELNQITKYSIELDGFTDKRKQFLSNCHVYPVHKGG